VPREFDQYKNINTRKINYHVIYKKHLSTFDQNLLIIDYEQIAMG